MLRASADGGLLSVGPTPMHGSASSAVPHGEKCLHLHLLLGKPGSAGTTACPGLHSQGIAEIAGTAENSQGIAKLVQAVSPLHVLQEESATLRFPKK